MSWQVKGLDLVRTLVHLYARIYSYIIKQPTLSMTLSPIYLSILMLVEGFLAPVHSTATPPPYPDEACAIDGYAQPAGELSGGITSTPSAALCWETCISNPNCRAADWVKPEAENNANMCFIKGNHGNSGKLSVSTKGFTFGRECSKLNHQYFM